jgi:hypothetical protein
VSGLAEEYTDTARARLALSAAAAELSDDARGLVPTEYESTHEAVRELIERVDRLSGAVDELRRLAVIYARERTLPWEDIGQALGVARQTVHQRFAGHVDQWHDSLYDPTRHRYEWLPDGAYNPEKVLPRLEAWLAQHDPDRSQPGSVAAGLPAYTPMQRTLETLARARWLSDRLRDGQPISPEADADHHRRKDIAVTEAMAETERLRTGRQAGQED